MSAKTSSALSRLAPVLVDISVNTREFIKVVRQTRRQIGMLLYQVNHGVPNPIRGGTFYYCPWQETTKPGTVTSCGIKKPGWATGTRFRTDQAYRHHYRKYHAHEEVEA